jgi:hypothetical protein
MFVAFTSHLDKIFKTVTTININHEEHEGYKEV